ncbi:MAG: AIM24 family protein, partial [Pseudomonadota bacterium]|nr:AIM24 family protein [Pseudomonadota bacterium]
RNYVSGNGAVYIGGYGAIYEREVDGEYIIDSSHVLGYSKNIKIKLAMSGGIFSSFFSGEGLVARVEGKGKVYLQSRSIQNMARFINPRLP